VDETPSPSSDVEVQVAEESSGQAGHTEGQGEAAETVVTIVS
jgi:hypothetical protein